MAVMFNYSGVGVGSFGHLMYTPPDTKKLCMMSFGKGLHRTRTFPSLPRIAKQASKAFGVFRSKPKNKNCVDVDPNPRFPQPSSCRNVLSKNIEEDSTFVSDTDEQNERRCQGNRFRCESTNIAPPPIHISTLATVASSGCLVFAQHCQEDEFPRDFEKFGDMDFSDTTQFQNVSETLHFQTIPQDVQFDDMSDDLHYDDFAED